MQKPVVVFLIDHPSRDLLPSFLIGNQLKSYFCVDFQDGFFTPNGPNFFKRVKKNEKFIVTPSYNISRTPNIRLRKRFNNSTIIQLHSEQLLAPSSYYEKFNLDNFQIYNKEVSLHLVWNDDFKKVLIDHGIHENKIKVVGNPKFDILLKLKKNINFNTNNTILFITNFNAADHDGEEWDKIKSEYYLDKNDISNEQYKIVRDRFIKNIYEIQEFCRLNGKKILIRKHPGEKPESYQLLENDVVKLSTEKELYKDLLKAEKIFQFTSSVCFESFILGIPTFSIKWGELESSQMQPPSEEYNWHDPSDVINIINNSNDYLQAIDSNLFNKYFKDNGDLATKKIAKEIDILISNSIINYKNNFFAFINFHGIVFLVKFIINFLACRTNNFLSRFIRNKIIKNYNEWLRYDHYCDIESFKEAESISKKILKNDIFI
jgi:surface carbohydrate biosynthesis protein